MNIRSLFTLFFCCVSISLFARGELPTPRTLIEASWKVCNNAPIFDENDVKGILAKIDSAMDVLAEVQADIIQRFSKCDGDIAALQAQGRDVERISVPYHVASGQLKLVMTKARALRKTLMKAKPIDIDDLGPSFLPFQRQFFFIQPIVEELAVNSTKGYLPRVKAMYESLSELGEYWNDYDSEDEKSEALTWQLLIQGIEFMNKQSKSLVANFAPSDQNAVHHTYLKNAAILNAVAFGNFFKTEKERRAFLLEHTKQFTKKFSELYDSLSWSAEHLLGADREYDLLVFSMGTNELLKRYVKDLSP
jgi:hypothetical protein